MYGIHKSQRRDQNEQALVDSLAYCRVLDWPHAAADIYGNTRTALEAMGKLIGSNDLLIASHALYLGATLVTNNTQEFQRVPKLKVENWVDS